MQSSTRSLDETARQTSTGRRIVGVLASGLGRRSSSHYSPTGSPNSPSLLARRQFAFPILAVLAVAALGLWLLLPGGALRAQDAAISYAEGGKDAVATFTAEDPEGVTPITWSIPTGDPDGGAGDLEATDNIDSDFFEIDKDGMLKFKSSPDYEASETGDGGADAGNDNTYLVVVAATDATDKTGYHKVTVKVTEVAETGKVTWTTTLGGTATTTPLVQFQVGTVLAVAPTGGVLDKDVRGDVKDVDERLQWYRSTSKTGTGTAIENATSPEYTVTTTDVGKYIRVVAYYNVGTGFEESASLTSDYPVLGSRSSNEEPEFSPAAVTREVSEGKKGMNVGAPVTATDDIANALTYALMTDGDDDGKFKIDPKTGQITTRFDLNREATTPATATAAGACAGAEMKECTVTVTATDSAGAPTAPAATVTIKITNVDEKPTFSSVVQDEEHRGRQYANRR